MAKLVMVSTREKIHQELCKGLDQAFRYGNYTTLMHFVEALPNGVTKSKIILWIETYSSLRLVSIKPIRFKMADDTDNNYDQTSSPPYWEVKLPQPIIIKTDIKQELISYMHKFIDDPSDTAHKALLQVIENYKSFGNSAVKKRMRTTPANLLQGGIPSLGRKR